jgi:hypothetical protein
MKKYLDYGGIESGSIKQKTAMQQLIDWFYECKGYNGRFPDATDTIGQCKILLDKERQQIEDAANWDSKSKGENGYAKGHEYFTQTYEQ